MWCDIPRNTALLLPIRARFTFEAGPTPVAFAMTLGRSMLTFMEGLPKTEVEADSSRPRSRRTVVRATHHEPNAPAAVILGVTQ
jgi:hypothetical protein